MYRRRFLFALAPTAVAAAAISARPHLASGTDVARAYTPTVFSAATAFMRAAINRLIPSGGEGLGEVETGVAEFIDRQIEVNAGSSKTHCNTPKVRAVENIGEARA